MDRLWQAARFCIQNDPLYQQGKFYFPACHLPQRANVHSSVWKDLDVHHFFKKPVRERRSSELLTLCSSVKRGVTMRPGRLSRHVPLFSHAHHYRYYSVDLRAGLGRGSTSKWICGGWCIEICKMDEGKYLVMTRAIKCSVQSVKMSFSCNHNLFVHYYNCLKKIFFCWFKVFFSTFTILFFF